MQDGKWHQVDLQGAGLTAADVQALVQQLAAKVNGSNDMRAVTAAQYLTLPPKDVIAGTDPTQQSVAALVAGGASPMYVCHNKG